MQMERAPEVVEAAKKLSSRRNNFVATMLHFKIPSTYSKLISMQSAIRIGYIDVNLFNKQSVCQEQGSICVIG